MNESLHPDGTSDVRWPTGDHRVLGESVSGAEEALHAKTDHLDDIQDECDIPVATFDARAARAYGPLRAANRERNKDALDKLIASHALSMGVTLVTNNETDFHGFSGLAIENWVNDH